ncbi:hypothetical protein [Pseudofrankia sp. BMG5.36]|uniref:hypothetical protein n=1 Tax=Pseudofrankia sp. BMG5.36 TaxID=1834512 RepID=UPI0008DA282A|nr:hypothetical protein [Pseudofrankia sp. BMG5.36]OHV44854.1 hypothetical protein BCD48_24435 [Pseudofrankia sp. BMG5.36]
MIGTQTSRWKRRVLIDIGVPASWPAMSKPPSSHGTHPAIVIARISLTATRHGQPRRTRNRGPQELTESNLHPPVSDAPTGSAFG